MVERVIETLLAGRKSSMHRKTPGHIRNVSLEIATSVNQNAIIWSDWFVGCYVVNCVGIFAACYDRWICQVICSSPPTLVLKKACDSFSAPRHSLNMALNDSEAILAVCFIKSCSFGDFCHRRRAFGIISSNLVHGTQPPSGSLDQPLNAHHAPLSRNIAQIR